MNQWLPLTNAGILIIKEETINGVMATVFTDYQINKGSTH